MTPIQLLTLGHTVRVCYDLTNYAELSINSNGDLTIHKLVGGSPKIIDKRITGKDIVSLEVDSFGHPLNTPPTDRPLKVGDVLVCHTLNDEFYSLTLGKEYPISEVVQRRLYPIGFTDDIEHNTLSDVEHSPFHWSKLFTLKP